MNRLTEWAKYSMQIFSLFVADLCSIPMWHTSLFWRGLKDSRPGEAPFCWFHHTVLDHSGVSDILDLFPACSGLASSIHILNETWNYCFDNSRASIACCASLGRASSDFSSASLRRLAISWVLVPSKSDDWTASRQRSAGRYFSRMS